MKVVLLLVAAVTVSALPRVDDWESWKQVDSTGCCTDVVPLHVHIARTFIGTCVMLQILFRQLRYFLVRSRQQLSTIDNG